MNRGEKIMVDLGEVDELVDNALERHTRMSPTAHADEEEHDPPLGALLVDGLALETPLNVDTLTALSEPLLMELAAEVGLINPATANIKDALAIYTDEYDEFDAGVIEGPGGQRGPASNADGDGDSGSEDDDGYGHGVLR